MTSENQDRHDGLPPGQMPIKSLLRWGIDHPGITRYNPKINLKTYVLTIDGEVEEPLKLSWNEIARFPKTHSTSDFHCVEGWSVLNCKWEGIRFTEIVKRVKPRETANFVTFECADGYTTSLSLQELSGDDVLLAFGLDGKPLEEGYGFPLRLVVPSKYGYKSALWVIRIKFTLKKEAGYWEKRGYSDTADVWKNDRFSRCNAIIEMTASSCRAFYPTNLPYTSNVCSATFFHVK
jgi:DMSO/TMAO reductase YedYZ molybdopterin-dependent catalytic subunit